MNKLTINFDPTYGCRTYADGEIQSICRQYLEALEYGNSDKTAFISQELVLYMFRALLYKEYKHLQSQVTFIIDGAEVKFDSNMRTVGGLYPPSVYEHCCDILLGCV